MIIELFRRHRKLKRLREHLKQLRENCILGKDFNAAPWQVQKGILNFSAKNLTGDPHNVAVGDYCNLNAEIYCNSRGKVTIGDHVYMNAKAAIRCDYEIHIGNYCLFGPNARLWDTNNHPMSVSHREKQAKEICQREVDSYEAGGGPIIIEDNVWLCMNVIVLPNVKIGYGSVIGAGSVVTLDIPPMTFAAGMPATAIKDIPN